MTAVASVLQGLHTNKGMLDLVVDMIVQGKQLRVVATQEYETGKLELAQCFLRISGCSRKAITHTKSPSRCSAYGMMAAKRTACIM